METQNYKRKLDVDDDPRLTKRLRLERPFRYCYLMGLYPSDPDLIQIDLYGLDNPIERLGSRLPFG